MAWENLLWHTRYDESGLRWVRECRTCANKRYRIKRYAARRNEELEREAAASLAMDARSEASPLYASPTA